MAALWKLPCVFLCENNLYGMGTPNNKAAANTNYYARGDTIPGFRCDAQNVLMVRETMKWTKEYCIDNGPLFIEYRTYRYHGHSMSDPGTTYRTREEIKHVRDFRDPIGLVKHMLIENSWATEVELKDIEKEIRNEVAADVERLLLDEEPNWDDMVNHVGTSQHYIRGVTYDKTIHNYDF
jgi:pyruvate dehydrogenase E1 component alpha subunit